MYEIERKFLIKDMPDLSKALKAEHIIQGYLCIDPVIRLRKSDDNYYMTYKSKGLLKRVEYNMELNKEAFDDLIKKCEGKIINKTRYEFSLSDGNYTAQCDIFEGEYRGLNLVEVEFDSEESANDFRAPDWFGEEVTYDGKYQNSNLSCI